MTKDAARMNIVSLLIEGIWNAIKTARAVILIIVLVLSLALNVAIVAVEAVAEVTEEVFERLTGKTAPRALKTALLGQQVKGLGRTVAAQGRTITANATQLRHVSRMVSLRQRQIAALTNLVVQVRASHATTLVSQRTRVLLTTARIARRITNDALRNVGSVVGEAVPWLGMGVIAGSTALELKDACDNMRDLNELEASFYIEAASDSERDRVCGIVVPTADELWANIKAKAGSVGGTIMQTMPDWDDLPVLTWRE